MFSRYYKLPILDIALLIYFEHCIIAIFLFQNILSEKSYPYFFFFSSQRFVSPLILLTQTDPSRRLLSQGPKFPFLSLFPLFMWNAYLSLFLSLSLSLSARLSLFCSSLLRLLLRRVNTPIRTRGPACARTHWSQVVSFGPLLPRQLATVRPPLGRKYRVSEYHRNHPFSRVEAFKDLRDNERADQPHVGKRVVSRCCVTVREALKSRVLIVDPLTFSFTKGERSLLCDFARIFAQEKARRPRQVCDDS